MDLSQLWEDAKVADDAFQAALIAQFGEAAAGDARYETRRHNDATAAAREAFKAACARVRGA